MKKMIMVFLLALGCLTACARHQEAEGDTYLIYEVNKDETTVYSRDYVTQETDRQTLVEQMLQELAAVPENTDSRAAIAEPLKLNAFTLTDESVALDFDAAYGQMSLTGEVLTRAAIVRTLTQVEGIRYVSVTVDGLPLNNRSGTPIGVMSADQFLDNTGNEINTEEKAVLSLYFANESGDRLVKVTREVVYNSNISLEKLVMEQLILGTLAEETEQYRVGAVINPGTKVNSVVVKDGVCYVNLDSTFLTQIANVNADVTIYAIVNSLVELPDINKVQFSIDGDTDFSLKETMPLSETYGRNLEIVEEL